MVKLTGPGTAIDASGSLAKLLTFSTAKGKKYLKRYAKPKQPRTKPQVSIRAAMTFLSQQWQIPIQAIRDSWIPAANERQISPFNAYISANCLRHRNHQGMSLASVATELGNYAPVLTWHTHNGIRQITIDIQIGALNQNWYITFNHVTGTGINPTWEDAVHLLPTYSTGWYTWTWSPIPAGTYWFTFQMATYTGKYRGATAWISAIATD